jgi:hypothetical protein
MTVSTTWKSMDGTAVIGSTWMTTFTNRLLRQYFPKRTDLSGYAQSELDKVALGLNRRPRKTLGFETPASRLRASVAPTVREDGGL